MNSQYGLWHDKIFVYNKNKIVVYINDQRVTTIILTSEQIDYLRRKINNLNGKIGFNRVSRDMYFGGMVTSLLGSILSYSMNQSNAMVVISGSLLMVSVGLGIVGLRVSKDIHLDEVYKKVVEEKLLMEEKKLLEYKKHCRSDCISLSDIESNNIIKDLESSLNDKFEERIKEEKLVRRFVKNR